MQKTLAALFLMSCQFAAWYVAIEWGLGITPRSWAWFVAAVLASAALMVVHDYVKQEDLL